MVQTSQQFISGSHKCPSQLRAVSVLGRSEPLLHRVIQSPRLAEAIPSSACGFRRHPGCQCHVSAERRGKHVEAHALEILRVRPGSGGHYF